MITEAITEYMAWRGAFWEALDPRFYTIEYLDWMIANNKAQFIASNDAAIVVEIKLFPSGMAAVHGLVAAGRMESIKHDLIPRAEAWGKANGCDFAMIESRPGWRREMKDGGYVLFQESIVKEF